MSSITDKMRLDWLLSKCDIMALPERGGYGQIIESREDIDKVLRKQLRKRKSAN